MHIRDIGWGLDSLSAVEREVPGELKRDLDARLRKANEHFIRAVELAAVDPRRSTEEIAASRELLKEVLDRSVHYAPAWATIAVHSSTSVEGVEFASRVATRATLLDPEYAPGFYVLGALQASRERYESAERAFRSALNLDPENADYLSSLGASRAQEGRFGDAETLLGKALEADPYHQGALNNMAALLGVTGRPLEAVKLLTRTLEIEHDNVPAHLNLGNAYMAVGWSEQAASTYREVIDLASERPEGYLLLAAALTELGRSQEAEQVLRSFAGALPHLRPAPAWSVVDAVELARILARGEPMGEPSDGGGAPDSGLVESLCPVSADPTYGWTIENPIKVGGSPFRSYRGRAVLSSFGLPDGTAVVFERLSHESYDGVPIDLYEMRLGDNRTIFRYLWVDYYRYESIVAPAGLVCLRPIELEPMDNIELPWLKQ